MTISKQNLGGAPLSSLLAGESVPGVGDEAIVAAPGGPLGVAAVVRGADETVRVDLQPIGTIDAGSGGPAALAIAEKALGVRSRATNTRSELVTLCDRLAPLTAWPTDGSPLHRRAISQSTCEVRADGRPGSVYISEVIAAGATADDLARAAGEGSTPVEVGSAARWVPTDDGRGGSLWVLASDRLVQLNAQDVDPQDRGLGLAVALAVEMAKLGGAG